jgi:hypothetical protein
VCREADVQRRQRHPRDAAHEVRLEVAVRVARQNRDVVARLQSELEKARRQSVDALAGPGVGVLRIAVDDRGLIREELDRVVQHVVQQHGKDLSRE